MSVSLGQFEEKMNKSIESLANEYTTIRAGRANPHVLDRISVDYYGQPTNLQSVANISVSEARTLVIQPWETSLIKEIEKAILVSDLGLTPNNDGKVIRLTFPELTEERRKDLTKDVKKKGEDAKVAIRNIRRDANDYIKKEQKPAPLVLGYCILAFAVVGCIIEPISGFWLFLPQALVIIAANRKRNI